MPTITPPQNAEAARVRGPSCRALSLVLGALLILPGAGWAQQTINYPTDGTPLQLDPIWGISSNSLFPGTTATPIFSGNSVTVGGDVGGLISGGISAGADNIANNFVTINSGSIGFNGSYGVYGGLSAGSAVTGNHVTVNGGSISGAVYGGNAMAGSSAGGGGPATGNWVIITGGTVVEDVIGGGSYTTASDNTVTISGAAQMKSGVHGGDANAVTTGNATASNNTVTLSGGTTGNTYGSGVHGGISASSGSGTATASNNNVTINGTANVPYDSVYGGEVWGDVGTLTATGNSVTIGGTAQVSGNVYGGWVQYMFSPAPYQPPGAATGNTVTIDSGTVGGHVYGGFYDARFSSPTPGIDVFTGNTLNKNSDTALNGVSNFEFINFSYIGNAGINTLDTTPTGSTEPGVTVNTGGHGILFDGVISGTGSLTIQSSGGAGLELTGTNTYSGGTTVSAGATLYLGYGGATGSILGDVINNGVLRFDHTDGVTFGGVISGSGAVIQDEGTTVLTGTNTYSGGTGIDGGTLQISSDANLGAASGGVALLEGTLETTADIATSRPFYLYPNNATIQTDAGTTYTVGGTMVDLYLGAPGNLTKTGTGTLTLTNTNTYTGNTTVNAGTLAVNGSIASSAMTTVAAGAALMGTGTVGAATVAGTLAPGDGTPGTALTVNGALSFASGAQYAVNVTGTTSSRANVTGTAALGGVTVAMNFTAPPALNPGDQIVLLTATGGITGTPANTTLSVGSYNFALTTAGTQLIATMMTMTVASADITVTAPATGATPVTTAPTGAACGTGFTCGAVTWTGALSPTGQFLANTAYTASVTLTPNTGYVFDPATLSATINGQPVTAVTPGAGGTVTLQYTFPPTVPLINTGTATPVPTLGEWGMALLALLLAGVALRRRA